MLVKKIFCGESILICSVVLFESNKKFFDQCVLGHDQCSLGLGG